MSHRENSVFPNEQPSQAYSQGEVRCQGSRSDPKGLSLTANRDLAMAEGGVAGEKLRNPIFKSNLCPIKWWRYKDRVNGLFEIPRLTQLILTRSARSPNGP